jgi:Ala-tRNA(Pro) deacylase
LQTYLDEQDVAYDVVVHPPTATAMRTAEASHVPGDCLAKGVVLRDGDGYMLAVLPATRHINLPDLRTALSPSLDLAGEDEIARVFGDCERGAVPALGACYGVNVIVDDALAQQPEVYFEAGDHATLIRLSQADFARLTGDAWHGRFSIH